MKMLVNLRQTEDENNKKKIKEACGLCNCNILVVMTLNVISNVIDYIYKVIVI
jgi:hypothetical protein